MTLTLGTPPLAPAAAPAPDADAWLARLRGPRPVVLDLVVDEAECTPERLQGVLDGRFTFNGETHHLGARPDWRHNPSADVEWHILLHKFYYAAGMARAFRTSGDRRWADRFVELADSWMDQVDAGFIAADVTGRRVQNWIYALRGFVFHADDGAAPSPSLPARFVQRLVASLALQVDYLCDHLTPKRNHRTLELYAIFLAGVALPELPQAAHWRRFALAQTAANVQADLLPDGVHCELSTDYHHLALRNWLHVRTLAVNHGVPLPPAMDAALERALGFALHVHRPDGIVPAFSDGDARGYRPLLALGAGLYRRDDFRWVASAGAAGRAPARTRVTYRDAGYSVLRSGWGQGPGDYADAQHLVFDHGPLGEGNHGHLDCLSFELYAHGRPLLVDPGRCTYSEAGPVNWRVHFRSTAAHNTVCVDGLPQTRYEPRPVKGASRHASGSVRHRISGPAPDAALLESADAAVFALRHAQAASHAYDAVHRRHLVWLADAPGSADGLWIVGDRLHAPTVHDYALHLQLHPDAQGRTTLAQGHDTRLCAPGLLLLQPHDDATLTTLTDGWVSEQYGERRPAPRLRSTQRGTDATFDVVLMPWRHTAPEVVLTRLPVQGAGGPASLLQLQRRGAAGLRTDLWFWSPGSDDATWQLSDALVFTGRWLHVQLDATHTPRAAHTHAGARVQWQGRPLAATVALDGDTP